MRLGHLLGAAAVVALLGVALSAKQGGRPAQPATPPAQGAQAAPPPKLPAELHPDISGIWNRIDNVGSGSWSGLMLTFENAQLQPEYAAKLPPPQYGGVGTPPPGFVPQPYDINAQAPAAQRCGIGGGGFNAGGGGINIDSSGMSLMVGPDEVLMLRDGAQGARHIRLDGKGFPDPTRMNGLFSIGRWEGDHLVVTTRGFTSGVVQYGRGWTEPSTELTETFKLLPGGNQMVITYTYTDPKVYIKPLVYDLPFERLPKNVNILENWCDAKEWIEWNRTQQPGGGRGAAPAAPTGRGRGGKPTAAVRRLAIADWRFSGELQ
jgi:hypothetical protein